MTYVIRTIQVSPSSDTRWQIGTTYKSCTGIGFFGLWTKWEEHIEWETTQYASLSGAMSAVTLMRDYPKHGGVIRVD